MRRVFDLDRGLSCRCGLLNTGRIRNYKWRDAGVTRSPVLWRNSANAGDQGALFSMLDRAMFPLLHRRLGQELNAVSPAMRRPNGSRYETAAAVRANILQNPIDAVAAKGAFVRANPGFRRCRRQVGRTILTNRPKFEHVQPPVSGRPRVQAQGRTSHAANRPAWR